jgi:hypothetical protein
MRYGHDSIIPEIRDPTHDHLGGTPKKFLGPPGLTSYPGFLYNDA